MDPDHSSGAVPDPLKVLILSGPLAKSDKDALRSYIQTNLQLLYPYRETKVDLCPLPNHSLRSRLDDLTKLSTFIEKHDKHDTLRYDWVLPLFYLPPLTEPMYLDIEDDAVNIAQSIALEARKAAKHVLFTTIAQTFINPSLPSINELNEQIQKLGASDGSHLFNISLLLTHWNNPSHPQTYSLTCHRIAQHIAFHEHKWDNGEKLGLYHLSEQTKNILPDDNDFCDSHFSLEKTAKPMQLYRPFLTQECAQFVHLQGQLGPVRVELDFRCAQNMAKDGGGFDHLKGIKINNGAPTDDIGHSSSIVDQAFQKLDTTLRGIPDLTMAVDYRPGHSQLNYPGINVVRPGRVIAKSYVASLTSEVEIARVREEEMSMGRDGVRRPAAINGMWRLELNRPLQDINTNNPALRPVVENPFRRRRGRIIGEVAEPRVEPVAEPSKRTHSAASAASKDEDEVQVVDSWPEPNTSKRTRSAGFSAAKNEDKDGDGIPMLQSRQRLRHDEFILGEEIIRERQGRVAERTGRGVKKPARGTKGGRVAEDENDALLARGLHHEEVLLGEEIIRERPARIAERALRARRGPNVKSFKRKVAGEEGPGRGWRKGKGRK